MKKTIISIAAVSITLFGCGTAVAANSYFTTHPSSVDIAFTQEGQYPEKLLESAIDQSHSTLDVGIYSLTKTDIVDSIVAAKKRGVKVRVITDKTEAGNKYQKAELSVLKKAGIPIRENTHSGLMHLKVTIIDGKKVATGSYNYTSSASTTNDENLLIISDSQTARDYEGLFNQMWNDTTGFKNW